MRAKALFPITLVFLVSSTVAEAYPSAAVFTPTGEARPQWNVGLLAYTATNFSPSVSPGSSWFGGEVGLLPQWAYGTSGVSFGGLEVGLDIITPYGTGIVKPVLNAKLGIVTEGVYSPSVSVGLMDVSPALASMNFIYASATKNLRAATFSYGRVTLGLGVATGSRSQFNGTFPFNDSRASLMLAYESPLIAKRVGFVVDHLGGTSEISNTYLGATFAASDVTTIGSGVYIANDRNLGPQDGFYIYLTTSF